MLNYLLKESTNGDNVYHLCIHTLYPNYLDGLNEVVAAVANTTTTG
jgi:murein L,D-transpeptidase YafK